MMLKRMLFSSAFVIGSGFCLTGCSPITTPSNDSRYLARSIVPIMTNWANGSDRSFDLSKSVALRGYNHICLVGEYTSLNVIEHNLGYNIANYHSNFGNSVPELGWAVVGVKDGVAHAALAGDAAINLELIPGKMCVPAKTARLLRIGSRSQGVTPIVRLESKVANSK